VVKQRIVRAVAGLRHRWPWVDHTVRAYDRNTEVLGGQLAAAVTYYGFLSFFPLLALAFSLVGYVADVYPDAQDAVTRAVEDAFPSLIGPRQGQLDIQQVIDAKAGAGLIGLLGLAYAGLGWLDALRDGLRRVAGTDDVRLGVVKKKLLDLVVLAMLGTSLLASIVVSGLATAVTTWVLDLLGVAETSAAVVTLRVLSVGLAVVVDVVIFAILLSRLSGAHLPWRQVRSGALLAAVGFEVLKLAGAFLIARTTSNPLYATFGVVVGLLVWINLVSRLLIFAAAWAVTQPYALTPAPMGERGAGRRTGVAAATEPVSAVAPADYEAVPVEAAEVLGSWPSPASGGRAGSRGGAVAGALAGAGIGALVATLAARRRSRG
jgi:membrane protein